MSRQPLPGDYGLSVIGGFVGWLVSLGQAIIGDASRYTHAFVVLDDLTVIEARPGGAKINSLGPYLVPGKAIFSSFSLTSEQREGIVAAARTFDGVGYSFLNYAWLAGYRPRWLRAYLSKSGRVICSQLVDEAYVRAGVHLFDDGRESGDVTPGDLLYALLTQRGEH